MKWKKVAAKEKSFGRSSTDIFPLSKWFFWYSITVVTKSLFYFNLYAQLMSAIFDSSFHSSIFIIFSISMSSHRCNNLLPIHIFFLSKATILIDVESNKVAVLIFDSSCMNKLMDFRDALETWQQITFNALSLWNLADELDFKSSRDFMH